MGVFLINACLYNETFVKKNPIHWASTNCIVLYVLLFMELQLLLHDICDFLGLCNILSHILCWSLALDFYVSADTILLNMQCKSWVYLKKIYEHS